MPDTTTELVTAQWAAENIAGVTLKLVMQWRQMGLVRWEDRALGPSLYHADELKALATRSREENLKHAKQKVWYPQARTTAVKCCSVCGRDTRRRDNVCRRCIGDS